MDIKAEIKKYLDNRANEDALFAERYAKENKSIDECVEYVISCAYEKGSGKNIAVSRDEVFGWAVHYYDEDEVKIKKIGKASASATSENVELTEEEKQELKKRAEEEYKAMCINRLREDEKERRRKAFEKKKEERRNSELLMNNLFE